MGLGSDGIYRNSIFRKTRLKSHNSGKIREGTFRARNPRKSRFALSSTREDLSHAVLKDFNARTQFLSFLPSFLPRRQSARLFSAPSSVRSPANSFTRPFFLRRFFPVQRFIPLKETWWATLVVPSLFAGKIRKGVRRYLNIIGYRILFPLMVRIMILYNKTRYYELRYYKPEVNERSSFSLVYS